MPSTFPLISAAGLGVIALQPIPDVTPFTIRSGATYESILSSIRVWLRDELVPYLQEHGPEAIFQENVDTVIDTVNRALGDQAETVTAALNQAVLEVTTADIPITAALFRTLGYFVAPFPSGGDDTAVLQALIDEAQAIGGTVQLQAGTYKANLTTADAYTQVTVVGRGKNSTYLQASTKNLPVFRFRGMTLGGGGLRDLSLRAAVGGGGVGLEHLGASGTKSYNIGFYGDQSPNANGQPTLPFDIGWHLFNRDAGQFSENNSLEAEFLDCNKPVFYEKVNGNESFSGSGLDGRSVINLSEIVPFQAAITISDGALPYNAPCSVLVHGQSNGQLVFNNLSTSRAAAFHGNLRTEGINRVSAGSKPVWFAGTVTQLVAAAGIQGTDGQANLGNLYLVDKLLQSGGQFEDRASFRPFQRRVPVLSGQTVNIVPEDFGGSYTAQVDIVGPNYHYSHLLHVWDSPYTTDGTVTVIANPESLDGANHGVPIFTYTNKALRVRLTNNADTTNVFAYVSVQPFNLRIADVGQYQS